MQPGSASAGKTLYTRDTNLETGLTPDEARAFGEGGQGSTRPDADAPEQGPNGARDRDAADEMANAMRAAGRSN